MSSSESLEGLDPHQDGRMGVVEEDFQRMRGEVGEVVGGEFFEGRNKVIRRVLGAGGVFVSFELMLSREEVHEDREDA